jgi:hypothetical protein
MKKINTTDKHVGARLRMRRLTMNSRCPQVPRQRQHFRKRRFLQSRRMFTISIGGQRPHYSWPRDELPDLGSHYDRYCVTGPGEPLGTVDFSVTAMDRLRHPRNPWHCLLLPDADRDLPYTRFLRRALRASSPDGRNFLRRTAARYRAGSLPRPAG